MKICNNCGSQLPDEAKFCIHCGVDCSETSKVQPQEINPNISGRRINNSIPNEPSHNSSTNFNFYVGFLSPLLWIVLIISIIVDIVLGFVVGFGTNSFGWGFLSWIGSTLLTVTIIPMLLLFVEMADDVGAIRKYIENIEENKEDKENEENKDK